MGADTPQPPQEAERETALSKYKRFAVADEEPSALGRLRAFCSFAMSGQDWLDVEPFFTALEAHPGFDDFGKLIAEAEGSPELAEGRRWVAELPADESAPEGDPTGMGFLRKRLLSANEADMDRMKSTHPYVDEKDYLIAIIGAALWGTDPDEFAKSCGISRDASWDIHGKLMIAALFPDIASDDDPSAESGL